MTNFNAIKMTPQEHDDANARVAQEIAEYMDGSYADSSCAKSAMAALYVEAFKKGKAAHIDLMEKVLALPYIQERLDELRIGIGTRTYFTVLLEIDQIVKEVRTAEAGMTK